MLGGKPVIQHVYEQASKAIDDVYVATDDEMIEAVVRAFGGHVVMTSPNHRSGTERCWEAAQKIGDQYDVIINIQGDEPFVQASQLKALMECFLAAFPNEIATLAKPFSADDPFAALENVNTPKVVMNNLGMALYFSRAIIPYQRGVEKSEWLKGHTYYKHIGLYGYTRSALQKIIALPPSPLEQAESLEQLRWIENGYNIQVALTDVDTIGIDTPEDLKRAEDFLKNRQA
jgi:3-deoxy-manno-octulosonate cytidylyltransferase (CMP-KDO synthetase)